MFKRDHIRRTQLFFYHTQADDIPEVSDALGCSVLNVGVSFSIFFFFSVLLLRFARFSGTVCIVVVGCRSRTITHLLLFSFVPLLSIYVFEIVLECYVKALLAK